MVERVSDKQRRRKTKEEISGKGQWLIEEEISREDSGWERRR